MALATKCPHCNTIFRVAADQLKLRGGIVRCGACKEVFDGNAALVDPAAVLPPAAPVVAAAAAVFMAAPAEPVIAAKTDLLPDFPEADDEPVYSLDFDTSYDPFGILPDFAKPEPEPGPIPDAEPEPVPAQPESEPVPATDSTAAVPNIATLLQPFGEPATPKVWMRREAQPEAPAFVTYLREGRQEPSFDAASAEPVEHLIAAALPDDDLPDDDLDAAPDDAVDTPAWDKREPVLDFDDGRREPVIAIEPDAQVHSTLLTPLLVTEPNEDEPGFVRQGRRRERTGKALRWAMSGGSVVLLLLLLLQGVTTFRNALAASVPALKPTLVALCAVAGCKVDLPSRIDMLSVEQGELQTLSENKFSYATVLRNQSRSAQLWPSIELVLNDASDKPVLRRVLAPAEYLPPRTDVAKGFAPRSEQAVKIHFELAQLKASGYHIALFYP